MHNSLRYAVFTLGLALPVAMHAQSGAATYQAKCQMCHAADGSGGTPAGKAMKAISFSSPELLKASDAQFIASTKNGKGKMPAFATKLSDAEIKDTIAYVRTLQKK
jgi:mono/diheme cytochrome c family protein